MEEPRDNFMGTKNTKASKKGLHLISLLISAGIAFGSDADLSVTLKTLEKKDTKTGKLTSVMRIFSRGENKILVERVSYSSEPPSVSRNYSVAGSTTISEIDKNGDSRWDFLVFFDNSADIVEVFQRTGDQVEPVEASMLKSFQKDSENFQKFWEKALPARTPDQ